MPPKIKSFQGEPFHFYGTAKNHHQLKILELILRKDGYSFRFQYNPSKQTWLVYKKKKAKYHGHPK